MGFFAPGSSGNSGGGGGGSNTSGASGALFPMTNRGSSAALLGSPVTVHSSGSGFVLASASSPATECIGLLTQECQPGAVGIIQDGGELVLADWSAITGTPTLAAKADYFLASIPGKLVTVPPVTSGGVVQKVGFTLNPTTLRLDIQPAVTL